MINITNKYNIIEYNIEIHIYRIHGLSWVEKRKKVVNGSRWALVRDRVLIEDSITWAMVRQIFSTRCIVSGVCLCLCVCV